MRQGCIEEYRACRTIWPTLLLILAATTAQAQEGSELDTVSTNYGPYVSMILVDSFQGSTTDLPLVAYENLSLGRQGLAVSRCLDPLCREALSQTLDNRGSSNAAGVYSRILQDQAGDILIVHLKIGVGAALRVVRCGFAACVGGMGSPTTLNSIALDQGQAVNIDAAIGSDGLPVIAASLRDGITDLGLWVIKCSDAVCEQPTTQTRIDPSRPLSGRVIDMIIGDSGFPQIAFQDKESAGSNGEVALLSCNDLACTGQNETLHVLDDLGGSNGRIIDLKLSPNGNPVIAYAGLSSTLRVIACNDPVCAGDDDAPNIIPTSSPINQAVAMDIDGQGHPAIAAHSQATDSLEIIFCNDAACAGQDERTADLFQSENEDIDTGAWVDVVFDEVDRLQVVYQTYERAGAGQNFRSVYSIRCVAEGCSLVFSDRFQAMP